MTFARKSAGLAVLTLFAFATPASADIGQLVGTWQNVNSHDRGVIRFVVHHVGSAVRVEVFGNCTPTPCDWGIANAAVLGTGVQSNLPQQATVLSVNYNQGFAQRQVIIHIAGNQLRAEVLTQFTDNSGRANYFDSDLFNRVAESPPGGGGTIANEDCISFNPSTAHAASIQGDWKLVDGNMWMLSFGNKQAEAQRAALIVKHYQFNKQCFVGRPNPSLSYWLTNNHSAAGSMPGEDCVTFNPHTVEATFTGGMWKMMDGNHAMFSFPNQAEAVKAVQIVKHYGFSHSCFVGRPDPSMTYQRQ